MSFSLKLPDNAHELVKVVARVRPLNASERSNDSTIIVETDLERNEVLVAKLLDTTSNVLDSSSNTEYKPFTFDAVIDDSLTQREIYDKVFRSLVNSALEGFNGTIFAYGQTGTGKTFTMEGSLDSEEEYGVMPNAFKQIFDQITAHRDKRYMVGVSYFEIYQEEIIDLLEFQSMKKCVIHESPNGGVYIKGLSSYFCSNFTQISKLLTKGKKHRAVGATNMNEHSSRSHAIFQITIETSDQSDVEGEHIKVGKLNLVDLAGSERVSKTGAEGQRLKEASKINLSLSSLGNVISALVDGASFIPYRDSKLTRLLQDSLGGNSRTIMVATVGPAAYNYEETINTLRYATRAKNIENKPRLNENPKDAMLRKYQEEINRLRNMLEEKKSMKNSSSKPTTAIEEGDEGFKKANVKMGRRNEFKSESDNTSAFSEKQGIMDISKINELKEMLEPLGILFEGDNIDIDEIKAKLREETESLEKSTEMVKANKDKALAELKKAKEKLESTECKRNRVNAKIEWLESKVLNSGVEAHELLEITQLQQEQIEEKAKELETHKMRHEQLRKALSEKEMTNEEAFANLNALENDYCVNLKKLDKTTRQLTKVRGVYAAARKKHVDDLIRLNNIMEETTQELKLKKIIVDNFVPRKVQKDIDHRMRYDLENKQYYVEPSEFKSNNSCRPKMDNMLRYPIINLTRIPSLQLQPMENTFFTNENVLLLGPHLPSWPSVKYVPDVANPHVDSLIKAAIKDLTNTMIINCDHKKSQFRIGQNVAPSYVAVGPTILQRKVHSDKFLDFSVVPSGINIPSGANIFPLQIPHRSSLTHQQLLAFPLIKYTLMGELSFEDPGQNDGRGNPSIQNRSPIQSPLKHLHGDCRKPRKSSEHLLTNYGSPISPPSRPRSSRPGSSRSSFSPKMASSPVERDIIPRVDAKLRESVDPYEWEVEMENDVKKSISLHSEEVNDDRREYSEEERMLQRIHYFASRNECTSQAKKTTESEKQLNAFPKADQGKSAYPSRFGTATSNGDSVYDTSGQRNFGSKNSNQSTTSRPPSRRQFSNGDSYLG